MLKSTKTKIGAWAPKASKGKRRDASGIAKSGVRICSTCGIWFTGKRWAHTVEVQRVPRESAATAFVICPACRMKQDRAFEGEIILRGLDTKECKEALRLVEHVGTKAFLRDPLDRILSIEMRGSEVRITTSENQLAARIGKKINAAFNGALAIHWSREDEVVRVLWEKKRP